ncbi:hypothetical protein T484DRAFT_1868044 [Baffinella frigidus]|nr:hypothetical protein T484DRAFT_1868044 [Cryptophyta sp. CCMP2293]
MSFLSNLDIKNRTFNPEWDEKFEWIVCATTNLLTLTVWDKDTITKDDMIGSAFIDLELCTLGEELEVSTLIQNSKLATKLRKVPQMIDK